MPPALQKPSEEPRTRDLQEATADAISFLKGTYQPDALLMLDVMYRRFGIGEFSGALTRYDQVMAANPDDAPVMRVLRRIAVHDNPLQEGDLNRVSGELDLIIVPALYCDINGTPDYYPELLNTAADRGTYYLTHVLLASIWMQENGCEFPMPLENVYSATAALISDSKVINDLKLEAAAFLYLAGQGSRVSESFINRVIELQAADGGWQISSDAPGSSFWHATVLGLMLLLHVEHPSNAYPQMLAPA
ncbi:MAG: hypothetical protein NWF05_05945 [Candidatus Bathyarchaeota archaeon]|nr:hypothetical protein [Candidatus Bathyarchaeota archaeon]